MVGILKNLLDVIAIAVDRALKIRETGRRREVGLVLYRLQYSIGAITDTASRLQEAISAAPLFPKPTPWGHEASRTDPVAALLVQQGHQVAVLGELVQRLVKAGGDALSPDLTQDLLGLIEAKRGAIWLISGALHMLLYPEHGGSGGISALCTEYNGLVQLTTGRFVRQHQARPDEIVRFILDGYARRAPDLVSTRERLSRLYDTVLDGNDRLAIGKAARMEEASAEETAESEDAPSG